METLVHGTTRKGHVRRPPGCGNEGRGRTQRLTLRLDGITAGDYLTWLRDPEPGALGASLCEISVSADPLGDTVEALLAWDGPAPDVPTAAPLAGLPLTPEVTAVEFREPAIAS